MHAFRRVLQVLVTTTALVSLTALAPPPAGNRITDYAILAEQVTDVAGFVAVHQGLAAEALDRDPAVVAAWWQSLPERDRLRMPGQMPDVIGNLAGIDYASRDRANRSELASQIAALLELSAHHPLGGVIAERLAALQAIESALSGGGHRYLLELTTDSPPLAAISIGNLNKARVVTFLVPGMGTYTTDMQLWTRAAKNVYDAQTAAGASSHAVVAWVGYRTPPPGIEATRDAYADRGALLLARDILALHASRSAGTQPEVNVVAHSYGATTAAKALSAADLGVRSFVMLGSAGVDPSTRTAADLKAQFVFSGEAADDLQARWGRADRADPGDPAFGALSLPVDGDAADGLLAVTGHAPIVHSPWNDDPASPAWTKYADSDVRTRLYENHMVSFGYFDVGTQSLAAVGHATTPPTLRAHHSSGSTLTKSFS